MNFKNFFYYSAIFVIDYFVIDLLRLNDIQ